MRVEDASECADRVLDAVDACPRRVISADQD